MKTKANKVLLLSLILAGLALTGYPQGLTNNGGYITGSSSSYITFNGGSNMTLKSTTPDRTTFGNMKIDFTGTGTYKLTIPDDSYVTVSGTLTMDDSLYLKASSSGMASLITTGTVSGTKCTVEQFLVDDQWHLVSSPVANAKASVYTNIYLKSFRESDSTWSWIVSTTTPLNVTQGYACWASSSLTGDVTVKFKGAPNTGDKSTTITYNNGLGKGDGWNLIGNPYPSALLWDNGWTKSNVDATIYVYDGTQYLTWNYNLGGYGTKGNGYIPSTQGFWIKANAASPSLTIPNSKRAHDSQSFYKSGDPIGNMLTVHATGNGYSDLCLMGFHPDASNGFDSEYDAYKIKGIAEAPQVYTVIPDYELSVNMMASITNGRKVILALEAGVAGTYTLNFEGLGSLDAGYNVYLEDRKESAGQFKLINLRTNPQYSFAADPADDPQRFLLHFVNHSSELDQPFAGDGGAGMGEWIYAYEKTVYINYAGTVPGQATVYDLLGREVASMTLAGQSLNTLDLEKENGGYYIVRVNAGDRTETQKVFIR